MLETHLLVIGFLTVAGFAWVLHSRSLHRNAAGQWMLEGLGLERTADAMMLCVVLGLAGLAEWNHYRQASPAARQSSAEPQPAAPTARAPAVEAAYVGSDIGHTYHLPTCFYVGQMNPDHRVPFASKEDAESKGRHACTNCLSGSIALVSQPLVQDPEPEAKREEDAADDCTGDRHEGDSPSPIGNRP